MTKFFWQVWVRDKIKQFGFNAANIVRPIKIPNFFDGLAFETGNMLRVVYIPTGPDIVDAADQVVPFLFPGEFFDPPLESRKVVALEPESNGDSGRSNLINELEVFWQFRIVHSPVVEFFRHRVVVGKSEFR